MSGFGIGLTAGLDGGPTGGPKSPPGPLAFPLALACSASAANLSDWVIKNSLPFWESNACPFPLSGVMSDC